MNSLQATRPVFASRARTTFAVVLALNLPFLLCWPGRVLLPGLFLQSLSINLVLFTVPGVPLIAIGMTRGWLHRYRALSIIAASLAVHVLVLLFVHASGSRVTAEALWSGAWFLMNVALLMHSRLGGVLTWTVSGNRIARLVSLFLVAYSVFFIGATRIVPVLGDQDDDVQSTAHGLMTNLAPSTTTTRGTDHFFAHPPLMHVYVAEALTYYGLLDSLAVYNARLPDALALKDKFEHFLKHPYLTQTRTPSVFLASLTFVMLAMLVGQTARDRWLGVLTATVYATALEVFVRSSYAGYYVLGGLAALIILQGSEELTANPSRGVWRYCLLAGCIAAWADHKLIVLPVSVCLWEWTRQVHFSRPRPLWEAVQHPVVVGFALGTVLFWAYGLSISPTDFWLDHVRHHLVDRIVHYNARGLDMSNYPGVPGLWSELLRDTGYLLLPAGGIALTMLCVRKAGILSSESPTERGWYGAAGLWMAWVLVTAVSFTIVDWRQTKHLALIAMPLSLALGRAGTNRSARILTGLAMVALLVLNTVTLWSMAANFESLRKVPEW